MPCSPLWAAILLGVGLNEFGMFDDGDGPRTESARSLYSPYLVSNGFLISSAGAGAVWLPVRILGPPMCFLSLGCGDLAFDGEGHTVGAWYP